MKGNSILNKAKHSEDTDEWYTSYETIEKELCHYTTQFHGKIVLCNCDDPYESAFSKYFLKHFNTLKLKKLICTSFAGSRIAKEFVQKTSQPDEKNAPPAYVMVIEKMFYQSDEINDADIANFLQTSANIKLLAGNGDFQSNECIEYLKEADIIVTNPPFSKFKELFALIMTHNKKFLLISNQNAITYKEVFPYIKNSQVWIGYHFGDMAFKVPPSTAPRKTRFWIDETGQKWRSLGNAMWLTNLDTSRRHENLVLTALYSPTKYPSYDNYNAINVSRVADIPMDYPGIMGVPLTYLKYHNDEQFEIIGEANHGSDNKFDLFKPKINGKEIFKRILIQNKRCSKSDF
ncbi:MAG: adenine-specific methyltransferase EcoRI family protein [Faecalibacterium sp.]